ncbi:glycosyltransferase [Alteromonas sp. KUL49]|uniref:glycosyltransferase n=1 Tax=Alteromonas sp. KUL49 TaxID=2480798 RepID=UPI00102EF6FB|nr:glycosyltransferase [Alteromonas sp. KUL49]TAP40770.1 colanic acid biosynthesis glycosyltransferase WcaL [Alteromonas sp. KUL49]
MKHIGIVVPTFPVASETFVVTEINALVALGHKVTVFAFEKGPANHLEIAPTVECHYANDLPDASFKDVVSLPIRRVLNAYCAASKQSKSATLSLLRFGARLGKAARSVGIDHLHSHFLTSSLAHAVVGAALFDLPVSCVGHGHDVYQTPVDLPAKLKYCDFAVAVCAHMQKQLSALTKTPLHVVHCGVNTDAFSFRTLPKNTTTRFLFIGRLVEKKGLKYAIEALANIPASSRPSFHIVGDGEVKDALMNIVQKYQLEASVKFLGYKPPQWLQDNAGYYDGLIAPFCEAANGDRDTGPVVLKEAMAMGLPVISTVFMGCPEIVDNASGFLVPPKSSEKLKSAIEHFCTMSSVDKKRMRECARQRVEDAFCASKQARQLSRLINGGGAV